MLQGLIFGNKSHLNCQFCQQLSAEIKKLQTTHFGCKAKAESTRPQSIQLMLIDKKT
jgi:hypothetical protein